jgi:hypothetical protein
VTLGFVIVVSGAFEGRVEHLLSIAAAFVAPGDNRWNADGDACRRGSFLGLVLAVEFEVFAACHRDSRWLGEQAALSDVEPGCDSEVARVISPHSEVPRLVRRHRC